VVFSLVKDLVSRESLQNGHMTNRVGQIFSFLFLLNIDANKAL